MKRFLAKNFLFLSCFLSFLSASYGIYFGPGGVHYLDEFSQSAPFNVNRENTLGPSSYDLHVAAQLRHYEEERLRAQRQFEEAKSPEMMEKRRQETLKIRMNDLQSQYFTLKIRLSDTIRKGPQMSPSLLPALAAENLPLCTICRDKILDGDLIKTTVCSHHFHADCLDFEAYGPSLAKCPNCNHKFQNEDKQVAPYPFSSVTSSSASEASSEQFLDQGSSPLTISFLMTLPDDLKSLAQEMTQEQKEGICQELEKAEAPHRELMNNLFSLIEKMQKLQS